MSTANPVAISNAEALAKIITGDVTPIELIHTAMAIYVNVKPGTLLVLGDGIRFYVYKEGQDTPGLEFDRLYVIGCNGENIVDAAMIIYGCANQLGEVKVLFVDSNGASATRKVNFATN